MALPELHQLKPKDLGFVVHEDGEVANGFISSTLADGLRKSQGLYLQSHIKACLWQDQPWKDNEPLSRYYHVPNKTFVLILAGPELLNGKEWFYKIFFDEKTCWFPALKIVNVFPDTTGHDKTECSP